MDLLPDPSYGDLADEMAHGLLEDDDTATSPEAQKLALLLTSESVNFARDRFGQCSTEYAWELIKLASVARAVGEAIDSGVQAAVRRIMNVYYGEREGERILKSAGFYDIFVKSDAL